MKNRLKKIILVGGGSGGHIYPLLAIASAIEQGTQYKSSDIHFVVADNNMDYRYIESAPYSFSLIPVAKLRRYASKENIRDFFRFFINIQKAYTILSHHSPSIIFSKGGFVSLPIGIAAKFLGIPFYLHETDSSMGLSNKILSRFAKKVFTGFPTKNPHHIFVGNPVRSEFFIENVSQKKRETGLYPSSGVKVLILGGSQGAMALNDWARTFFAEMKEVSVCIIAGAGKKKESTTPHIKEYEFLQESFVSAVHEADIVISRAGGSIAELAAAQKCTILVPLPSAANNHQRTNAQYFSSKKAAVYIEEKDLYSKETKETIQSLLQNPQKRKGYEENISHFATPNTISKITTEILQDITP